MNVLAIDPGPDSSAFLSWNGRAVIQKGFMENRKLLQELRLGFLDCGSGGVVAIEMIASYGMPVGREVFETCLHIGRIVEICGERECRLVYRKDVKIHLCGSMKAKDGNIRQRLIDLIGPQGKKASPGPTYGLSGHDWAALAIAVYVDNTARMDATEWSHS